MAVAAVEPIIAWQAHEGRRVARVKGYDIIQCELCGFRHVLPLPDPAELEAARAAPISKEETWPFRRKTATTAPGRNWRTTTVWKAWSVFSERSGGACWMSAQAREPS